MRAGVATFVFRFLLCTVECVHSGLEVVSKIQNVYTYASECLFNDDEIML